MAAPEDKTADKTADKPGQPPLASLVLAGEKQTEAEAVTDFVFMANDISNAYLVTTGDGDVMVNTGFPASAARNQALFAPRRTGPLRYIVLTQSHPDHFGGLDVFREPETKIIAERRFAETLRYYRELAPYFGPRTHKLWGGTTTGGPPMKTPERVDADIVVDRRLDFALGGRRFEILSTPGGETVDSLSVFLPDDGIVFTGNLFGPVFMSMPFLNTIRGDKPRLVGRYLKSLDKIRDLGAEILITGHGAPVRGAAKVRADLDKLHAAVSYVDDETKRGMNGGKDLWTLMREVKLPEALKIGELHGNVPWAVRAIFHEYAGWFLYDSTTSLYGVPRTSVDADLVELAGGAAALAGRARTRLEAGQPLEAMHLLDIALGAEPKSEPALRVKRDALGKLLADCGGQNLSETMWLRSEIAATDAALGA